MAHATGAQPVGGPLLTRPYKWLLAFLGLWLVILFWRFAAGIGAVSGLTDGYCTVACDPDDASTCFDVSDVAVCNPTASGGAAYCQATCWTDLDCRDGYACVELAGAGRGVAVSTCMPL